ncbi:hypothetical protein [Streptomyces sp. NPDC059460]|uniref:hypothetical protein n=1 Tax=Streptomyces sp. NPDC059460 TaxID=3346840 RepID=UPI003688A745
MSIQVRGYERLLAAPDDTAPFADGTPFLGTSGFWSSYFLGQGVAEEELVLEAMGDDDETTQETDAALRAEDAWPVFRIPTTGDRAIIVVVCNAEGDERVDYLVDPGEGKDVIHVAVIEGEFFGPALSWAELAPLADAAPSPLEKARRLLLLAPAYGDRSHIGRAAEEFAWALREVGASGDVAELADWFAGAEPDSVMPDWSLDEDGAWSCDGEYSYRNRRLSGALDTESRRAVDRVLRSGLES